MAASAALMAPTDHWEIVNDGRIVVQLINEDGSNAASFTFDTPRKVEGLDVANLVVTVPASQTSAFIGPFPVDTFGETLKIVATAAGTKKIVAMRV